MRRWMIAVAAAALIMAVLAGWGIGQMAGGGSGDETPLVSVPVNTPATMSPPASTLEPTEPSESTVPTGTPEAAGADETPPATTSSESPG